MITKKKVGIMILAIVLLFSFGFASSYYLSNINEQSCKP